MHLAPRPVLRHLFAAVVVAALATALLPAMPASAKTVKYDKRLFGVHDTDPTSWPAAPVGSLRLWDAGVTWRDLEVSPGVWDWSRLDAIVGAAEARGVEVTLVLGQTPDFHDDPSSAGAGPTYMPNLSAWTNYVSTVAARYKGRIEAYQVWNEVNVVNYWAQNAQNTPAKMGQLTSAAYGAIKAVDPSAIVVGPAFATRLSWQRTYLGTFYGQRVNGVPVWKRMDAIALNLYPLANGTPEASMKLLKGARTQLTRRGVPSNKPIWNTEVNYGLATGGSGASGSLSGSKQAAYVVRTYLLNAAQKIKRVHWYAWDRPQLGSTKMVLADGSTPTLAGKAFALAQSWMLRGKLVGASKKAAPCAKDRRGTYTCIIKLKRGVKRVYWNPSKRVKVATPSTAKYSVTLYGVRKRVKQGKNLRVDYKPVMVYSKR
jgi:hypothetical protein